MQLLIPTIEATANGTVLFSAIDKKKYTGDLVVLDASHFITGTYGSKTYGVALASLQVSSSTGTDELLTPETPLVHQPGHRQRGLDAGAHRHQDLRQRYRIEDAPPGHELKRIFRVVRGKVLCFRQSLERLETRNHGSGLGPRLAQREPQVRLLVAHGTVKFRAYGTEERLAGSGWTTRGGRRLLSPAELGVGNVGGDLAVPGQCQRRRLVADGFADAVVKFDNGPP